MANSCGKSCACEHFLVRLLQIQLLVNWVAVHFLKISAQGPRWVDWNKSGWVQIFPCQEPQGRRNAWTQVVQTHRCQLFGAPHLEVKEITRALASLPWLQALEAFDSLLSRRFWRLPRCLFIVVKLETWNWWYELNIQYKHYNIDNCIHI